MLFPRTFTSQTIEYSEIKSGIIIYKKLFELQNSNATHFPHFSQILRYPWYTVFPLQRGCGPLFEKLLSPSLTVASCQVCLKLVQWFWRRRWKCEKYKDDSRQLKNFLLEKLTWVLGSGEQTRTDWMSQMVWKITNKLKNKDKLWCCVSVYCSYSLQ